jgi:hypothetical protein
MSRIDSAYNKAMTTDPYVLRKQNLNTAISKYMQVSPLEKSVCKNTKPDDSGYYEALGLNEYG